MAHAFACQLALIAFATAAAQGVVSGAPFDPTLKTALVVVPVFYALGWILGELARRVVEENVQAEFARIKASANPAQNTAEPITR